MTADQERLSILTEETTLAALRIAASGKIFDLSQDLSEMIPMGPQGVFAPFTLTWRVTPSGSARGSHYQFAAEHISGPLHVGTHIDGLAHVAAVGRTFGGRDIEAIRSDAGLLEFGIETVPPIVTRGVVFDIPAAKGVPRLADGYEVTVADLKEALERTGEHVQYGDAALVKTGKGAEYRTDPARYQAGQPGVGPRAAIWLYEQGMALLGTDTAGTEPLPFPDETFTTHQEMLVERGVHLVENLNLSAVGFGAESIDVGVFICLPLRIVGATGSWVRPILIG